MDGTSGALYSIFLNALTQYIKLHYAAGSSTTDEHFWAEALHYAAETLSKYTPAKIGDRTMMDALLPFVSTLQVKKDVNAAANAAEAGAELTKGMKASLGRAVYVGGETEWIGQIPDPGAWGVSRFLKGLAISITSSSSPFP
jgi:dihydroxyacetone kinase